MTKQTLNSKSTPNEEISLKELILKIKEWRKFLWRKKWIIVASCIVGALLGFGYASSKKVIYTATTTFVLESGEKSGGLGAYAGIASMMGIDLGVGGGGIFQGDNILELYRSRAMLEKTLFTSVMINNKKQTLMQHFIDFNGIRRSWEKKPELLALNFESNQENSRLRDSVVGVAVDLIRDNYLVVNRPDKKLGLVAVQINSPDENFSKFYNDELVNNVNQFYIKTKTRKALENVTILTNSTDSVRALMNGSIYTAATISDATPNLNPTRQVRRVVPLQKAQFSAEANKEMLKTLVQNLEIAKLSLIKEKPLIQEVDKPIFPLKKKGVGRIKNTLIIGVLFSFLTMIILVIGKMIKVADVD